MQSISVSILLFDRYYLVALCLLFRLKSWSAKGAYGHSITRLLVTGASSIYQVDEFHLLLLLFVPRRPTKQQAGWRNLVCVECLQMIKQTMVGFCWGLMLLWTLGVHFGSTSTVKGSERSPGLFQDFEDGYTKV